MNKQEEIREGLMLWMGAYGIKEEDMVRAGVELFKYHDSQGVVIKVEGELPVTDELISWSEVRRAGYTLTIPLIEEIKVG